MKRVLVIKLGAMGDVVLAAPALARIRAAHPEAEITVLTTPLYRDFLAASPYADKVETDGRPRGFRARMALLARLRRARYDRVYDLQNSGSSRFFLYGLWPFPPRWSGVSWGASHRYVEPRGQRRHVLERQAGQLQAAGIWPDAPTAPGSAPGPDLSWLMDTTRPDMRPEAFGLTEPYLLLIPGCSPHWPQKRWPVDRYAALARWAKARGMSVGVIGGAPETALAQAIPDAVDLTAKTDFVHLAALGAQAALAVGNDTGPTHLVAAAGAPTVALFSGVSDPALSAPRGRVTALRRERLEDLPIEAVTAAATALIGSGTTPLG